MKGANWPSEKSPLRASAEVGSGAASTAGNVMTGRFEAVAEVVDADEVVAVEDDAVEVVAMEAVKVDMEKVVAWAVDVETLALVVVTGLVARALEVTATVDVEEAVADWVAGEHLFFAVLHFLDAQPASL